MSPSREYRDDEVRDMSGAGGSGAPAQPSTPWAGMSQAAGAQQAQITPAAAMPPVPGMTPGATATPYRPPMASLSGFTPQAPGQTVNPTGMQSGMPQINSATGTGGYIGAPGYLTQPAPPPAGYGLDPSQQSQQQQQYRGSLPMVGFNGAR